jgi:hypothetical protein
MSSRFDASQAIDDKVKDKFHDKKSKGLLVVGKNDKDEKPKGVTKPANGKPEKASEHAQAKKK